MPWLELQLTIDAAAQPRAEAVLEDLGALSVTLMDADADTPDEDAILEPGVGEAPLWKTLTLLALFDAASDRHGLLHVLHDALPELAPDRVGLRNITDQDWERAWMDGFQPMRFGGRLWIYPWNIEPPSADAPQPSPFPASGGGRKGTALRATDAPRSETVIVRLDPGLAFGSGSHPTTALCLTWLDSLDLAGATVIDYGCGSGILAIAALKLGAARAVGVDHDAQALLASRGNAERNGVGDRLVLLAPEALPRDTRCEVLLANILANPLHELAPWFAALCKPDTLFALSGILAGQETELLKRYAACGFQNLMPVQRADWIRISGRFGKHQSGLHGAAA